MAFSGGVFVRLYSWAADAASEILIRSDRMDAEFDGIATGLSKCVLKDGTQTITNHIPWNGKRITGLGDASADTDALNRQSGDGRFLQIENNLSDVGDAATARTSLELGALATLSTIDTDQIDADAITAPKINSDAVTTAKIIDNAITTAKISDDQVTLAKLAHGTLGDLISLGASGSPAFLAIGTEDQILKVVSGVPAWADADPVTPPTLHVQDQKSEGTDGGTFNSGAWRQRDINTVVTNTITGASLASDTITLPAGTYDVLAFVPAYACSQHAAHLYNDTDSTVLLLGKSAFANSSAFSQSDSVISGRFTIADTKDLIVRHRCASSKSSNGFGLRADHQTEVYTDITIRQVL